MDKLILILTALALLVALIPIYLSVRGKLRKRYKFDLNYNNIFFSSFSAPQAPKIDKCLCLIVYGLRIVNNSDEPHTLKNVIFSYRFEGKKYRAESFVVLTGTIPESGEPAIVTSNGLAAIFLMGWHNIRSQLGEYETLQPGGVFSGSAVFLFESHINDLRRVKDLKLVVTDYHGTKSSYPIAIQEEWFQAP